MNHVVIRPGRISGMYFVQEHPLGGPCGRFVADDGSVYEEIVPVIVHDMEFAGKCFHDGCTNYPICIAGDGKKDGRADAWIPVFEAG